MRTFLAFVYPNVTPSNKVIFEGSEISVACEDNNPPPLQTFLQWLDPDGNIVTTDSLLDIRNISLEQAGVYLCEVTSRSNDDTGSTAVNIVVEESEYIIWLVCAVSF